MKRTEQAYLSDIETVLGFILLLIPLRDLVRRGRKGLEYGCQKKPLRSHLSQRENLKPKDYKIIRRH
jgi:hypothetical protein